MASLIGCRLGELSGSKAQPIARGRGARCFEEFARRPGVPVAALVPDAAAVERGADAGQELFAREGLRQEGHALLAFAFWCVVAVARHEEHAGRRAQGLEPLRELL